MGKFSCVIIELEGLTVSLCDEAIYWLAYQCQLLLWLKHLLWLLELWNHVASSSDVEFFVLGWKLIWNKILVFFYVICLLIVVTTFCWVWLLWICFWGFIICWSWCFIYILSFSTIFWVFVFRLQDGLLWCSWTCYQSNPVSLAFP